MLQPLCTLQSLYASSVHVPHWAAAAVLKSFLHRMKVARTESIRCMQVDAYVGSLVQTAREAGAAGFVARICRWMSVLQVVAKMVTPRGVSRCLGVLL